jgi:hypothetical protein
MFMKNVHVSNDSMVDDKQRYMPWENQHDDLWIHTLYILCTNTGVSCVCTAAYISCKCFTKKQVSEHVCRNYRCLNDLLRYLHVTGRSSESIQAIVRPLRRKIRIHYPDVHSDSTGFEWQGNAQTKSIIILQIKLNHIIARVGNALLAKKKKKKQTKTKKNPCNSPWRPLGLLDVEAPTFSRQTTHRWREVVSLKCRPPFTPRNIPGTHFF